MGIQEKIQTVEETDRDLVDMLQVVIGGSEVLIRSSEIREVVRPIALTPVPMGPDHILGLANIHGQIVSVIDVGRISSLPISGAGISTRTRLLVLRHPVMQVAIRVDEVKRLRKTDARLLKKAISSDNDLVVDIEIDGFLFDLLDSSKLFHASNY